MRFIDLCAGIGGFRLGFERQGFKCVYSCEIDEATSNIYQSNFTDNPFGDILKINPKELPDFEILLAGFSCQPFSIAGKQEGFLDKGRGNLFFDILHIIKEKQPKVVVLENVKNILNHDKGNTFKVIKEKLEKVGYLVSYKILNAKNYGVAQNRERLIIVATKTISSFNFNNLKEKNTVRLKDILKEETDMKYLDKDKYILLEEPKLQNTSIQFVGYLKDKNTRTNGVDPTKLHLSRVHRQFNRIYGDNGVMCTLMAQESSGRYWVKNEKGVRKLTRDECKLLMGFPVDFNIKGSNKLFYKCIGNSICVPMVEEIAKELKKLF